MGPQPPGTWNVNETQYFAHTLADSLSFLPPLSTIKSQDSSPPTYTGSQPHYVTSGSGGDPNRYAFNARAAVIADGTRKGRLIVASSPIDPAEQVGVTYSDNPGDTNPVWAQNMPLNQFGTPPFLLDIFPPGDNTAPMPGAIPVTTASSIATDPVNPNRVYVAFTGRVAVDGSNLDLFIARSDDFGTTFPSDRTVRITDGMVRICASDCSTPQNCTGCPENTDEWLPAITVDKFGGINLMFFRTQAPDETPFDAVADVRYVRWASDAALTAGPPSFRANLASTVGDPWWGVSEGYWINVRYGYHTLAASGCYVYAAYAAKVPVPCTPPGDYWRVFVRRILVGPCIADLNRNGIVNGVDLGLFFDSYVAGDPAADMNADEFVDGVDVDEYIESYCEGCPTDF